MRKAGSTYELGRAAFAKGTLKFSDDERMLAVLENIVPEATGGAAIRETKQAEISEWKKGWNEAKAEAEAPVEAPKKKKKVSKKKKG